MNTFLSVLLLTLLVKVSLEGVISAQAWS